MSVVVCCYLWIALLVPCGKSKVEIVIWFGDSLFGKSSAAIGFPFCWGCVVVAWSFSDWRRRDQTPSTFDILATHRRYHRGSRCMARWVHVLGWCDGYEGIMLFEEIRNELFLFDYFSFRIASVKNREISSCSFPTPCTVKFMAYKRNTLFVHLFIERQFNTVLC